MAYHRTAALIPFLKDAEKHLKFKYKNITATAPGVFGSGTLHQKRQKNALLRSLVVSENTGEERRSPQTKLALVDKREAK